MPMRRTVTDRSTEPRRRYAEQAHILRQRNGLSLRQLAKKAGWDASQLSKVEGGQTLGGPELAQALDDVYGTPEFMLTLWELAQNDPTQFKEQYRRYMSLEAEATSLWHFGIGRLPGLLQAEGYATEILAAGGHEGEELARQVEARLGRAELLTRDGAPNFRTILYESVLRAALRDPQSQRAQLEHLLEASGRPNIALQVLPFSSGPFGLMSTDVMFLRDASGRTVAYTENDVHGELIEDNSQVEPLQLAYDAMRDLALSPAASQEFIGELLEGAPCAPPST
ncbi:helix-turn-helix transcriptional regulator [Streptomyces sp. NPDC050095]|uniref:helix-turn-helix domain-containing protein n=1 Tax=unclassified Streptomyces TaxID=2593676 RepID=UPI003447E93E